MEKLKKSAGKKKKKSKKTSSKCGQSPDNLEVEGHRKFEPTGMRLDVYLQLSGRMHMLSTLL